MPGDLPEPIEAYEAWLLRRVAQAVEVCEIPADILAELRATFEVAREMPQEEGHTKAVRDIAERLDIPLEEAEKGLRAIEAQPSVTRELLMRRIAEAWLESQRKAYQQRPQCD